MSIPDQVAIARARREYLDDGVTCLRNVVEQRWIDQLRVGVDEARANLSEFAIDLTGGAPEERGKAPRLSFWGDFSLWQRIDPFRRFMLESDLGATTAAAVGCEKIRLFYDYLLVKEPFPGTKTPWHQDRPFYPVDGDGICSVWVALDWTTLENGGLEYVAGSHRWGMQWDANSFPGIKEKLRPEQLAEFEAMRAAAAPLPDIDNRRSEYRILAWDLNPGDILIHHAMAVHGAPANRANTRRSGYAIRWMYEDVSYKPGVCLSAHLRNVIEGSEPSVRGGEVLRGGNFPEFSAPAKNAMPPTARTA